MKAKKATTVEVARRFFQGKDPMEDGAKSASETLEVRTFVTEPAEVGLTFGLTHNLGHFRSARVDVTLRLPCYAEEADDAYAHAERWVASRVKKEIEEAIAYARDVMNDR